jgi:hypothetical protein
MIIDLTNSFKANCTNKTKKTQTHKAFESYLVERTEKMSNQIINELNKFYEINI